MRAIASVLFALSLLAGAAGAARADFDSWGKGGKAGPPTYWTQQDTSKSPN
jgi:hypothetical protein